MMDHKKDSKYRFAFRYHSDGQIAQAVHGGKSENFLRDGLALIQRGKLPMRIAVSGIAKGGALIVFSCFDDKNFFHKE